MLRVSFNKECCIFLGLTVLAIALMLPTLGSPLIEDEAISFNRYIDVPWKSLILSYQDTNQHTLFLLLSKFFIRIFGESETVFRLPSFIVGVLSVPLTYQLGLAIKMPWPSALTSALLMGLSWPHLKYSLEGRGYGLTIFLVLLATYAALRFLNSSRWIWGSVLTGTGFIMTMALPSNLFFLVGLAVFTVFARGLAWKENRFLIKKIFQVSIPFLVMFTLIGIYFLVIYEGLKHGRELHPLSLDGARIGKVLEFIVAPWGLWLYLFLALGAWQLKRTRERILFMSVILVPIILTLGTGVVGFARNYVYWLPFVLFLSTLGMAEIFLWLKKQIGNPVYGLGLGFIFLLAFLSAKQIYKYYAARTNSGPLVVAGPNATLSEASQMAMWVGENIPKDNLIVISTGGPESSVLNRYMGKTVLERMTYFARGGELEKVVFIAHQDMPPGKYPFVPMFKERPLKLPASKFNKIHSLGNLGVYELDLKVERFIPSRFDPDYEGKIGTSEIPQVNIRQVDEPRAVGKQALYIENQSGKPMGIISPIVKGANISEEHAYILYVFIAIFKPFHQQVSVHLAEKRNWPPIIGYLNPSLGMFRSKGSADVWHIHYSLSPLSKGKHYFQERIEIQKEGNHFDGLQSYLLTG